MNRAKILNLIQKDIQVVVIVVALVLIMAVGGVISSGFLSVNHLIDILYLNTMTGILAIAQTLVILTGGIDMSIGATYWLTVMLGAQFMRGGNLWSSMLICMLICIAIGFVNGLFIAKLKIPYVVMTIAMMVIITGILYVTTGGGGGGKAAKQLTSFAILRIFRSAEPGGFNGIPVRVLIWIGLTVLFSFILNGMSYGWKVRAIGSNQLASLFSGLQVERIQILTYTLSAVLAGIAGLFYLGQARTPYPSFQGGVGVGSNEALTSIACVVVGGTFFSGGTGGVWHTFLGVIALSILFSVLAMMGFHEEWQVLLKGVIILLIVGAYNKIGNYSQQEEGTV